MPSFRLVSRGILISLWVIACLFFCRDSHETFVALDIKWELLCVFSSLDLKVHVKQIKKADSQQGILTQNVPLTTWEMIFRSNLMSINRSGLFSGCCLRIFLSVVSSTLLPLSVAWVAPASCSENSFLDARNGRTIYSHLHFLKNDWKNKNVRNCLMSHSEVETWTKMDTYNWNDHFTPDDLCTLTKSKGIFY